MSKQPTETTTNQVRQILANELGLSRETVQTIITERIEILLKRVPLEKLIEDTMRRILNELVHRRDEYGRDQLRAIAADAIKKQIEQNIVFTIGTKP